MDLWVLSILPQKRLVIDNSAEGICYHEHLFTNSATQVKIWGTGNEKLNWTTLEDSARYTVEAIHDPSAHNQVVKVSGDTRTLNEFAKYVAEASGSAYKTTFLGSFEDLAATVAKTFQEQPQNFYAWMPLQYAWGFVSEKFVLNPLWNSKYPNVKPTTLEEWVKEQKW